ncbi:RxLR effector protein [Phytophthora megakarya]|uniref:RxLR effector protein n=1 Tax=Phytophthora megakarya TaxID=4795 RepID=A0A225V6L3_9STRA|nr:RxLR effector protein [Phytophthora megakarya]
MPDKQQFTEQLFTNLKVGQVEANVFKSDQFGIWASSVSKSYGADRDARNMAMVSTLTAQYGDETLSSMLAAAKEVQETKGFAINMLEGQMATWVAKVILSSKNAPSTETHAIELWTELPDHWRMQGKSADEVFKLLELNNVGKDKLLENPMWNTWVAFLEKKP